MKSSIGEKSLKTCPRNFEGSDPASKTPEQWGGKPRQLKEGRSKKFGKIAARNRSGKEHSETGAAERRVAS